MEKKRGGSGRARYHGRVGQVAATGRQWFSQKESCQMLKVTAELIASSKSRFHLWGELWHAGISGAQFLLNSLTCLVVSAAGFTCDR